jgi:hypothetical protein
MTFFIPSDTFLGVVKLHVFGKKILGTLGDALASKNLTPFFFGVESLFIFTTYLFTDKSGNPSYIDEKECLSKQNR